MGTAAIIMKDTPERLSIIHETEIDIVGTTLFESEQCVVEITDEIKTYRRIEHDITIDGILTRVKYTRLSEPIRQFTRIAYNLSDELTHIYKEDNWIIDIGGRRYTNDYKRGYLPLKRIVPSGHGYDILKDIDDDTYSKVLKIQKRLNKAYEICCGTSEICNNDERLQNINYENAIAFNENKLKEYKKIQDEIMEYIDVCTDSIIRDRLETYREQSKFIRDPIDETRYMQYFVQDQWGSLDNSIRVSSLYNAAIVYICRDKKSSKYKIIALLHLGNSWHCKITTNDELDMGGTKEDTESYRLPLGGDIIEEQAIPKCYWLIILKMISAIKVETDDIIFEIGGVQSLVTHEGFNINTMED